MPDHHDPHILYHVVTVAGTSVMAFDAAESAFAWIDQQGSSRGQLSVVKVTTTTTREAVKRPAVRLVNRRAA